MSLELDVKKLKHTKVAVKRAQQTATAELWRRGAFLSYVLDSNQQEMVKNFKESEEFLYIWLASRRIGKSVALIGVAMEEALANPDSRILYLSKTTDNVLEIIDQASSVILKDCPIDLAPTFHAKDNKFRFKNGSEIRIKGLDNTGPDVIRGIGADLVIFDEFCFMRHLSEIISSVVMPMIIERGGRVLMGSTPPKTPGHDSIEWIQRAEKHNSITVRNIYDCPRWTNKQIVAFAREAGGVESDIFKREYMAQIVVSRDAAILPSFTDNRREKMVVEVEPPYYVPDTYVSLDIGFRDLSVALFGWWDYENARLIIEDEIVLVGSEATTANIAELVSSKEYELWGATTVHKRICDTDPRLIEDLKKISNLDFRATKKDNKEAQVNQTNIMIGRNQIVINPRCKTLILHMRYGIWNDARTQFARTKALGHCDAVDALLYMVRNVDRGNNPITSQPLSFNQVWHGEDTDEIVSDGVNNIRNAFKRR